MKVVMGHLRAKGIRLIIYLEDILILSLSFSEADNSTAVCYFNSFCEERSISLEAFFLPGKLNVEADEESRAASDSSDWMLCRRSFQAIDNIWATDVDLFSASWNHQHDRFISWRPQPGAWAVNAFSKNWGEFKAYGFPPSL
jgi:hypothetical protein